MINLFTCYCSPHGLFLLCYFPFLSKRKTKQQNIKISLFLNRILLQYTIYQICHVKEFQAFYLDEKKNIKTNKTKTSSYFYCSIFLYFDIQKKTDDSGDKIYTYISLTGLNFNSEHVRMRDEDIGWLVFGIVILNNVPLWFASSRKYEAALDVIQ